MAAGIKYIERVRMAAAGFRSEHIDEVEYRYESDGDVRVVPAGVMARLIDDEGWDVRVRRPAGSMPRTVSVRTVHPYLRPPYLRTFTGDMPTDDLLELPRF